MATYQPLMAKQQTQRGQRVKREGCGYLVLRFFTGKIIEMLFLELCFVLFLDFAGGQKSLARAMMLR